MITIEPIRSEQIPDAKRVILSVARNIFGWPEPLDEIIRKFDRRSEFHDMEDAQAHYFDHRGLLLVVLDDGRVVGCGGVRQLSAERCELKRIWLLENYHGRGIGYRVVTRLLEFARDAGYTSVELMTDIRQARALKFYRQLGFQPMASKSTDPEDVFMEMEL